jgi:glycerol-3-phosphate acyltransferase PlsY
MELGILAFFYLIGSIPVAWLMCKLTGGDDIRNSGSGNAGVMNVALNVSRWAGLVVFAAEIAKGLLTVGLARRWELSEALTGLAVLAAVAGTRRSVWIYASGGRGNTLIASALLALAWPVVAIGLGIWAAGRLLLGSSYRATRLWMLSLPLTLGLVTGSWPYAFMGAALALFYLGAHKMSTDDHAILKKTWPSLWDFITAPPRKKQRHMDELPETKISLETPES